MMIRQGKQGTRTEKKQSEKLQNGQGAVNRVKREIAKGKVATAAKKVCLSVETKIKFVHDIGAQDIAIKARQDKTE